ncbi:MAG: two-component system sensor histidine kinase TctE [Paracoccaceae bacterium]|jgi:two-component system sensor histidine kinase TctE
MRDDATARGSIRRRLTVLLLSSAAALAVVLYFVFQNFARQLVEESHDNILAASVTAILDAAAVRQGQVTIDIPYSAFSMLGNVSDDRVFYAISQDAAFLTGYQDLPHPTASAFPGPRFETRSFQGQQVRMATSERALSISGKPVQLRASVAQTRDGQVQTLAQISRTAMFFGLGFFALAAALTVLAVQSTIRPLQQLAESISRRGPQDLRPVTAPVPAEMVPLVGALNRFMARLKTSLTRSEDFIAEAAHRVRTPLATVRTQAEITLRRVDRAENRASLREMIRAIDESSRAAGQLLDHAMVTFRTDTLVREPVDLAVLAQDMVDRLGPLADLKDIALTHDIQAQATVLGDPILIQNALRNLLDNAIKYSPADSAVTVSLWIESEIANLRVTDQGAGFPETGAAALTDRFVRGSNAAGVVGSGLGLTIADEVAQAHGGSLTIANTKNREGACVTLSFPLR